jgi:hypothetical protein
MIPEQVNWTQYESGGHYESFYLRANHPTRPLAFWLRYTIFSAQTEGPKEGELWAVVFDGETKTEPEREGRGAARRVPVRHHVLPRPGRRGGTR